MTRPAVSKERGGEAACTNSSPRKTARRAYSQAEESPIASDESPHSTVPRLQVGRAVEAKHGEGFRRHQTTPQQVPLSPLRSCNECPRHQEKLVRLENHTSKRLGRG